MKTIQNGNSLISVDIRDKTSYFEIKSVDFANLNTFLLCIAEAYDYMLKNNVELVLQQLTKNDWNDVVSKETSFRLIKNLSDDVVLVGIELDQFREAVCQGFNLSI